MGSSARSKRIDGVKPKKRTKGKAKATNDREEVPVDATAMGGEQGVYLNDNLRLSVY